MVLSLKRREFLLFILFHLFICNNISSQITVGSGIEPEKGALLDIKSQKRDEKGVTSQNGGLLLPNVNLEHQNSLAPFIEGDISSIGVKYKGLMVYNLNPSFMSGEGIYSWNGVKWSPNKMIKVATDNAIKYENDQIKLGGALNRNTTISLKDNDFEVSTQGNNLIIKGLKQLEQTAIPLVVSEQGEIGKSNVISRKLSFLGASDRISLGTLTSGTKYVDKVKWRQSDIASHSGMVEIDPNNTTLIRIKFDALVEISGTLSYVGNGGGNSNVILYTSIEIDEKGDNKNWQTVTGCVTVFPNAKKNTANLLNIPPVLKVLRKGSLLRITLKSSTSHIGEIVSLSGESNGYSRTIKILAQ